MSGYPLPRELKGLNDRFDAARAFQMRGELVQAKILYEEILTIAPRHFNSLHMLGVVNAQLSRPDLAVDLLCKAIEIVPDSAPVYYALGYAMCKLNQYAAGVECFDKALVLKPDFAQAACDRGSALIEVHRCVEAIASFDLAIRIQPDYAEAFSFRGNAWLELGQLEQAIASFDVAIKQAPKMAGSYLNRGNAYQAQGEYAQAIASYDAAITLRQNDAMAYSNRSVALKNLHRFAEALASCNEAIRIAPEFPTGHWNLALILLLLGDLHLGFVSYLWRWRTETFQVIKRNYPQPVWLGESSVSGKTVLLHAEQGLGDTLQFARYAKLVADQGAHVVFEVEPALFDLFQTLPGVSTLIRQGDPLPEFDVYCPLLSLPVACKTSLMTVPHDVPYLGVSEAKHAYWARLLGPKTQPRVGLVWSGSATHKADHLRSIPLDQLLAFLPDGFQYISLQKEVRASDLAALDAFPLQHFGDQLSSFSDTAALCALMDVVISVDTSVVHLSGALGCTTWVLLPHLPDWRWLLERNDSPWYPSARLYRQAKIGDWTSPLELIRADLQSRIYQG